MPMAVIKSVNLGALRRGPVGETLDENADDRRDDHGDGERGDGGNRAVIALPHRAKAQRRVKPEISAQHINVAVREVDEAQHAINHRVAEGDERVNRALRETVDKLLHIL